MELNTLFIFILGASIGSFINVLINRVSLKNIFIYVFFDSLKIFFERISIKLITIYLWFYLLELYLWIKLIYTKSNLITITNYDLMVS